jgi:phosphatidylserine/phosphatidylglycerophosphate/cardiolipin synthase-like enzyme
VLEKTRSRIVVDRKRVLLGSQNWSNDGVSVNRDASLLFDDEELAGYFAKIFDHNWNNLAKRDIGSERVPIELVAADESTPPGMVRLSWKDYMEML